MLSTERATALDALLDDAKRHNIALTRLDASPEACPPGSGQWQLVAPPAKSIRPSVMLYVHGDVNSTEDGEIFATLNPQPERMDCAILKIPAQITTPADLRQLLARNPQQFDLVYLDSATNIHHIFEWFQFIGEFLAEPGLVIGTHPMSPDRDNLIQHLAHPGTLDLTLGSNYWICTRGHFPIASPPLQMVGEWKTIKFSSLHDELATVEDRNIFLSITGAGIPCKFEINGGHPYRNVAASALIDGKLQTAPYMYYHPYAEDEGITGSGFIAYARNIRVQGVHAHLYSPNDGLYKESLSALDQTHFHLAHPWDPFTRTSIADVEGAVMEVSRSFFPREIQIKGNCIIVNMPDIWCYHHWIYYILPKFWYLDQFPELAGLPIVMSPLTSKFQTEYLDLLGIGKNHRFIFADKCLSYRMEGAYIPTIYERPYHSKGNLAWLRDKMLKFGDQVPAGYEAGLYFVTRKNVQSRNVLNEEQIISIVSPLGFKCLDWAEFTVREQISLARNARVIIIPNGSGISNLVYFSPGIKCMLIVGVGNNNGIPELSNEQALGDLTIYSVRELGGKCYVVPAQYVGEGLPQSVAPMILDVNLFIEAFMAMVGDDI